MLSIPWRPSLDLALQRNLDSPQSRFAQLATQRADGRPVNRTMVFRGFLEPGSRLAFTTDARSRKADDLTHFPWAEACWYFVRTREQFRLSGRLSLVGPDHPDDALRESRLQTWRDLSEAARVTFTWPAPGAPRSAWSPFPRTPPDPSEPLDDFALLILEPDEVDHLELNGAPQNRWRFLRDDVAGWNVLEVNP